MPNNLIHETSPYLLQHAHNPVNWYPWGKEALEKAEAENKPILVSIGYAACHWCHVMEHESFEDEATAAIMNEHFINIKIDREERPDLDHIYMDALQAMVGNDGWPLNIFLTPNKKPFYGGTYFPPQPYANKPSWKEVLIAISNAFKNKRNEIEQQANNLTAHIAQTNNFGIKQPGHNNSTFTMESVDVACFNLLKQADTVWGGFGTAPKFPQTFSIQFLLRYYHTQKNNTESAANAALAQALLSLDKMIDGGIYDQLGGGFARYSTDKEWLVPHFEKMLYDNALLIVVLSEAYQLTKKEKYKTVIIDTIAFVERELKDANGGFYAALDADSEGKEGKFYIWSFNEVLQHLQKDAKIFCDYFDISHNGNWEGENILRVLHTKESIAAKHNIEVKQLDEIIRNGKQKLFTERAKRARPGLDDKIILGWNALMNYAYTKAYMALGNDAYKLSAIENMQFLLQVFTTGNTFSHVYKNGISKYSAFLDDLAYLIQALLNLHRITGNTQWLAQATTICETVQKDFIEENGYFYFTPVSQQDVIVRKKEIYDGATPAGNSIMAGNLLELGILSGNKEWQLQSEKIVHSIAEMITKYPTSFGIWNNVLLQIIHGTKEIVVTGHFENSLKEILSLYLPNAVIMAATIPDESYPLFTGKESGQPVAIYLCENYTCKKPVNTVQALINAME